MNFENWELFFQRRREASNIPKMFIIDTRKLMSERKREREREGGREREREFLDDKGRASTGIPHLESI